LDGVCTKILLGALGHFSFFHILGISMNFITPTDELHHFSEGWRKTTNQNILGQPHGSTGTFYRTKEH
jgi:hypothetical protein